MEQRTRISGASSVVAAALMAAAAMPGMEAVMDSILRFPSGTRGSQRRRGPGWSNRQVKRVAQKKRNQARNRNAHRG